MKILAIVPTHDRTQFIPDALASLQRQTRPADEIVVIGNVGPGIITNETITVRLNKTIENSDCDAFFILCDDDMLEPTYIEKTAALMERTGADIVYSDIRQFGSMGGAFTLLFSGKVRKALSHVRGILFNRVVLAKEWTEENIDRDVVPFTTSLFKKSAWRLVGGFDQVPYLFDWHFPWKCYYAGAKAVRLAEPLFLNRRSPEQDTNRIDQKKAREEILGIHKMMKSKQNKKQT